MGIMLVWCGFLEGFGLLVFFCDNAVLSWYRIFGVLICGLAVTIVFDLFVLYL